MVRLAPNLVRVFKYGNSKKWPVYILTHFSRKLNKFEQLRNSSKEKNIYKNSEVMISEAEMLKTRGEVDPRCCQGLLTNKTALIRVNSRMDLLRRSLFGWLWTRHSIDLFQEYLKALLMIFGWIGLVVMHLFIFILYKVQVTRWDQSEIHPGDIPGGK